MKNIKEIIKLCITPFCIFSPIPIFAITLFLISSNIKLLSIEQIWILIVGCIASIVFTGAANFWNHVNDIEEDILNGKDTILTNGTLKKNTAISISAALYLISLIIITLISIETGRNILLYFTLWMVITWLYSTKIIGLKFKSHYITEIITYIIAYPTFTMSIWLIFSNDMIKGLALSIIMCFLSMSGLMLKDIKDIKGDTEAGLRTLGVVFPVKTLFKSSCVFLTLYYIYIFFSIIIGIFNVLSFVVIVPFLYFFKKTIIHFILNNWNIGLKDAPNVKAMMTSVFASLLLLGVSNYIGW